MAARLSYVKHVVTKVKHMVYMTVISYIIILQGEDFQEVVACLYTAGIYEFEIWQTANSVYKTINKLSVNSSLIAGWCKLKSCFQFRRTFGKVVNKINGLWRMSLLKYQ